MDFKDELKKLVDFVEKSTKMNKETQSIDMGNAKNYLADLLTPTGIVTKKTISRYRIHFRDVLEKTNDTGKDEDDISLDSGRGAKYDLEIELKALIQTNKLLAEAHKIFAEANLKLATTNERLSVMANYSSTAFSHQQIPEAFDTMIRKLLELIADGLTVKKPRTREEAIALLSKVYHDDIPGMI